MAKGNAQFIKDIIDDTKKSTQATYSSDKIEKLLGASNADMVYLTTVSATAPAITSTTDKYYNTSTKLVYSVDNNAWDAGEAPKSATLYIDEAHNKMYVEQNGELVIVSGSGGDISEEQDNALESKPDGFYVKDLSQEVKSINIAQKTVNELGYDELLSTPFSFATKLNSTGARLDKTVTLDKSIEDYNFIEIYLSANNNDSKRQEQVTRLIVSDIVYNATTAEKQDMSIFNIQYTLNGLITSGGDSTTIVKSWFQDATHLYLFSSVNPNTGAWASYTIEHIIGYKKEVITIDPVNYIDTTQGIQDTPVGHIMSMMGNDAPAHYLKCDGTVYNITDYPDLAQYFKDQFGVFNKFGGDGVITFAVPDLRGEFLRGSNLGDNTKVGASVGTHQEPTIEPNEFINIQSNWLCKYYDKNGSNVGVVNPDKTYPEGIAQSDIGAFYVLNDNVYNPSVSSTQHSTRPTNTSVLWVIKYEPTYFIGTITGYEQVDDLLDNPIELGLNGNNAFNSIHQSASIKDMQSYDKIEIVTEINTSGPWMYYNKMSIDKKDIIFNTTGNYSTGTMLLSSNFGSVYAASVSFNFVNNTQVYIIDTLCNTANWTKIRIKAIRGIKSIYKIDNKTA